MKQAFYLTFLLLVMIFSCEKDKETSQVYYNSSELQGYRGDTISLKTININPDNTIILIPYFFNDTLRSIECPIIPGSKDIIRFVIPYNILYSNDEISSYLVSGEENVTLEIYHMEELVLQAGLKVLFEPVVHEVDMPYEISYGDTVKIYGRDLDINTLAIEFNSLNPKFIQQTSRELTLLVPDSCGNGDLTITCSSNQWAGIYRDLAEQEFEIDFIPDYKIPKKVTSTWNKKDYYDYDLEFNTDNRIIACDDFNAVGEQHKRWKKYYEYNNFQQLICSKSTIDDEISHVDSFRYIDNKIIETIFTEQYIEVWSGDPMIPPYYVYDSLLPYAKIEYELDDKERIISSNHFYINEESKNWEKKEVRVFDFFEDKKCNLTITEINSYLVDGVLTTHENKYESLLIYNSKNQEVPLQLKTYMNGLYLLYSNDLDYVFFPGSLISKERITYAGKTDVNLYYDSGGNLVKEEYFYISHYGAEPVFIRSSTWEY